MRIQHCLCFAAALLGAACLPDPAAACTGIRLTAADGTAVRARTLEFGTQLDSDVIFVPRSYARTGTTPAGANGRSWAAKYASLGANGAGLPYIFDGLNERGLSVGTFYFPTTAGYMKYVPATANRTIAPWEVGSWILENCATLDEVRQGLADLVVAEVEFKAWGFVPPVHYIVCDPAGRSVVIEYVEGKLHIHDNPLGVMSNSPSFDWHMTNLRNYVSMSPYNRPPLKLGDFQLNGFGQGTGMLGLPGDFTPPSRLVRAVAYSSSILPAKTGPETVIQAFHILNNFDIPKGAARDNSPDTKGNVVADYTLWTSAIDHKAKRFYFRTYENSQIRSVDLASMPGDSKAIVTISMKGAESIKSLNP